MASERASKIVDVAVRHLNKSQGRRTLVVQDLDWYLYPPMRLGQYRLYEEVGQPVALALWALVDEETDQRIRAGGTRRRLMDWRSGKIAWLVDLIAPMDRHHEFRSRVKAEKFRDRPLLAFEASDNGMSARAIEVQVEPNAISNKEPDMARI